MTPAKGGSHLPPICEYAWGPQTHLGEFTSSLALSLVQLLALSVIRRDTSFCPLLDNNGQSQILGRDSLSAYDPERTWRIQN